MENTDIYKKEIKYFSQQELAGSFLIARLKYKDIFIKFITHLFLCLTLKN